MIILELLEAGSRVQSIVVTFVLKLAMNFLVRWFGCVGLSCRKIHQASPQKIVS